MKTASLKTAYKNHLSGALFRIGELNSKNEYACYLNGNCFFIPADLLNI